MPPLAVNLIKIAVVIGLWSFILIVARAVRDHLRATSDATATAPAPAVLVFVQPAKAAGRVLAVDGPVVVGRGAGVDAAIDDPFASDRHVMFDRIGGRLIVEDLGSTNGTLVNGRKVNGRRTLDRGDAVHIGQTIMEVR